MTPRGLITLLPALLAVLVGLTMWTAAPQAAPVQMSAVAGASPSDDGCNGFAATCVQYCGLVCQALPAPAAGVIGPSSRPLITTSITSQSLQGITPLPARPPPR